MRIVCLVIGVLLTGSLALFSCNPAVPGTLSERRAVRLLIPGGKTLSKYQLSYTFDPYNGGTFMKADTSFLPTLLFFSDGEFVEYDRFNFYEGEWRVSTEKDQIHFQYHRKNAKDSPEASSPQAVYWKQSYKLLNFQNDSLIMGAQGRHGIVRMVYHRSE